MSASDDSAAKPATSGEPPGAPPQAFHGTYGKLRRRLVGELYDRPFTPEVEARIGWSPEEQRANARLYALRREVVMQPGYYDDPWESKYFILVRDKIAATGLFAFLQRMPKGAILHVHPTAMGDFAALVGAAAAFEEGGKRFFVAPDGGGDPSRYFVLAAHGAGDTPGPAGAAAPVPAGPPAGYLPLGEAWARPEERARILGDLVLTEGQLERAGDGWTFFQPIFARVGTLLWVPTLAQAYYAGAFRYLVEDDRVVHVELRTSWQHENEGTPNTKESVMLAALEAVNAGHDGGDPQPPGAPRLTMKAIWSDSRHVGAAPDREHIKAHLAYVAGAMRDAAREGKPSRLAGYDLVGEEDTGETSRYFLGLILDGLVAEGGRLYPRFFFHDGESDLPPSYFPRLLGDEDPPADDGFNNNLVDAYLLNTLTAGGAAAIPGRVGHGIALFKTPDLMARYRRSGIAIELCPISNQLLHYLVDLREHPGQTYLAAGVPCSLSPDDPAIYGYQGVTFDFWLACVAWNLDLKALKLLAYDSLRYAALGEEEKQERIARWMGQWSEFVAWVNAGGK